MKRKLGPKDQAVLEAIESFINHGVIDIVQMYKDIGYGTILISVLGIDNKALNDPVQEGVFERATKGFEMVIEENPTEIFDWLPLNKLFAFLPSQIFSKILQTALSEQEQEAEVEAEPEPEPESLRPPPPPEDAELDEKKKKKK